MEKTEIKKILISILIGALVAFLQTLLKGVAEFLQTHAESIISGAATSVAYLVQKVKPHA